MKFRVFPAASIHMTNVPIQFNTLGGKISMPGQSYSEVAIDIKQLSQQEHDWFLQWFEDMVKTIRKPSIKQFKRDLFVKTLPGKVISRCIGSYPREYNPDMGVMIFDCDVINNMLTRKRTPAKEGLIECSICEGKGIRNNEIDICSKCYGEGKIDWIENIVGVELA